MYKLVILIILASLLIDGGVFAESLPAPSSHDKEANISRQQSSDEQNKTNNIPNSIVQSTSLTKITRPDDGVRQEKITESKNKTEDDDSNNFRRWPPTSGWAIVFITLAYVIISGFQWRAIHRQARIAQQALNTSERAWVGIGFERPYILGNDLIDLKIFNSGKSVGHIRDMQLLGFELVDKGEPIPDNPKSVHPPGMGTFTIFPGESTFQRWDVQIDKKEITEVAEQTKLLRIYGFIRYTDIFGIEHITKFYRVWMEDGGPLTGKFMIPPDAAPGQNEAT